jgi:hypothetical protein
VEQILGLVLPHNDHDLREHLRDGVILCKLLHNLFPESIQVMARNNLWSTHLFSMNALMIMWHMPNISVFHRLR